MRQRRTVGAGGTGPLGGRYATWQPWSGVPAAEPGHTSGPVEVEVLRPGDTAEVAEVLAAAARQGRRVRPIGSRHSFSAIGRPVDVAVDLSRITRVRHVDLEPGGPGGRVRVGGGITLHDLNATLDALGLALPNLGDIDAQTLTGALATGTHGTGVGLHTLASAVRALTLVTPDGTVHELRAGDELFDAARINLGALGIVTEVEVECVPAFRLRASERPMPLEAVLHDVDAFAGSADHAEFFWFPHTRLASTRRNTRVPAGVGRPLPRWRSTVEGGILANGAFELVNRVAVARPGWVPRLNRLSASLLGRRTYADASHSVFCSVRGVRFVETEYAVPRAATRDVLEELAGWFAASRAPVSFPLEVRFLAADDVWLSGSYGRDSAYIAVHQYWRGPYAELFALFERVVAAYDGRPHWGKMHSLDAERLDRVHPRLAEFRRVRDRLDPARVMTSPHLGRILG